MTTKQLLDKLAQKLETETIPGDRVGWLTYLIERLDGQLESSEFDDLLVRLRAEIDQRLGLEGW